MLALGGADEQGSGNATVGEVVGDGASDLEVKGDAGTETVSAKHIQNVIRTIGGLMFLSGTLIMSYNLWRTIRMPSVPNSSAVPATTIAPQLLPAE